MFIENSTSLPIPANSVCVRTVSSGENPFKFQERLQTTGRFFEQLFVILQLLSRVRLFATPWTAARQASLSFTISQSLLKLKSVESMMPSNHLILCHFLLLLPSVFPSIRVFSSESALHIRRPKDWSFSISPSSEYSGLISLRIDAFDFLASFLGGNLESPRDSQESSPAPQMKSTNSSVLSLPYDPTLTSIYDYWRIHSFDYLDFCWQSDVSAF